MLIDLLREAASAAGEREAVVTVDRSMTYADLLARSEALAGGLAARGIDRFGAMVDDRAELLALLGASSAAGAEACVYPYTTDAAGGAELAAAFDHRTIVTDHDDLIEAFPGAVTLTDLLASPAPLPDRPPSSPVMILTTGTTGRPKGARHDWARLIGAIAHPPAGARWLLAYNLNQFAGIQVVLHALAGRGTLAIPPSAQPRVALPFARQAGATHISATPTFWRFTVAFLKEGGGGDLHLQQITLGGEAVPADLIADLRVMFPAARISQVYASTEAGSTVSVGDDRNGLPVRVLERDDDAAVQMKIVDGELYVRSRVGMLGYHGDDDQGSGWRASGDLVEVRGDRIHFVGRVSEVINVGGVKVHPLPIEEVVLGVPGVVAARAFGRPNAVSGQIVSLEVVAAPSADVDALESAIREACRVLPPAGNPRRVRFVPEIATREHKVVRAAGASGSGQ